MPRFIVLASLLVVMLVSAVAWRAAPVVAQEATPAADANMEEMEMAGVAYLPLGYLSGLTLPSSADLFVIRLNLEPGAGFPVEASDPSNSQFLVESGAVTIRVDDVAWTISRGAALQDAMASGSNDMSAAIETVEAGADVTLEAGDVAFVPGNVNGEVRNDGTEPASGLIFNLVPTESTAEGTPTS